MFRRNTAQYQTPDEHGRMKTIFSTRFFVVLLVVIFAALFAANAVWLLPSLRRIENDVLTRHITIAERARSAIEQFFHFHQLSLESLAARIGRDPDKFTQLVDIFLKEQVDFQSVVYIDAQMQEQLRRDRLGVQGTILSSRANETGIERVFQGEIYMGPVFYAFSEPVSALVVPIRNPQGQIIGALEGHLNFRSIWNLMATIRDEDDHRVYVVDQKGNLIADPDPSVVLRGENLLFRDVVRRLFSMTNVSIERFFVKGEYRNENNTSVFAVGILIRQFGWGVFVERDSSEAFAARNRTITLAGISFFIAMLLMSVIGRSIRSIVRFSRAMDREREHVSAILLNLTAGVIEYGRNFSIILMNPAAERLLNVSLHSVRGERVTQSWFADPVKSTLAKMFFKDADQVKEIETPFLGPRAHDVVVQKPLERNLRVTTVPIMGERGEITNFLKVVQDVTQEKLIARLKSEFITIAAHQLRTPLSAIKWTFRILLDGDLGEIRPRQKEVMERGYTSNENMIRLVNDLLDVSRIEEGRFGYEFAKHDLKPFLEEIIQGTKIELEKKQLQFRISIADNLPQLTFDTIKLRLALSNIIENAVNYTSSGGTVTVSARRNNNVVEIVVTDTGVGIPDAERKRLFTKFFRGSNVMRMQTNGSGLGLFLAKNIVLSHGGDIRIDSTEGKGTTVTITLPVSEKAIPSRERVFEEFVAEL